VWGERLRLDDGEAVATFAGGDLDGSPAVLRRRAPAGGEGWYVGTVPPQHVLEQIVDRCLRSAGVVGALGSLPGEDPPLPEGVEAVRRGDVLFLLNATAEERHVVLAGVHQDLLTGKLLTSANAGGTVRLGPEGAVALVEVALVEGVPLEVVA
jgi:beta-galactosidase